MTTMKISVLESSDKKRVRFKSAFGEAVAQWNGRQAPQAGADVVVELDVGAHGAPRAASTQEAALAGEAGALLLRGVVESMGPDDVSFHLRVGDDVAIIDGTLDPALVGQWVELDVKELGLIDVNY